MIGFADKVLKDNETITIYINGVYNPNRIDNTPTDLFVLGLVDVNL